MEKINEYVKVIWDYMLMHQELKLSDAIFVLCSNDLRVAERAAELYTKGYAPIVICSGGFGKNGKFSQPEAVEFSKIIMEKGVPKEKIIIEDKATNTGENILFTKKLLQEKGISVKKIIAVQKPYMERRTFATLKKQWPEVDFVVTAPQISPEEYSQNYDIENSYINVMVGDLLRIREYPKLGFQIEQEIPDDVWNAGQELIKLGYSKYII